MSAGTGSPSRNLWGIGPRIVALLSLIASLLAPPSALADGRRGGFPFEARSLDGRRNNHQYLERGVGGTPYSRVADAIYADGIGAMVDGPDPRYVSNRVFNDLGQNLFSRRGVTQWASYWGQFLDHSFGLRESGHEWAPLGFDDGDVLEEFSNELGMIPFTRSRPAPGSGEDSPREQINTVSSYIDAWAVYGGTQDRLEWMRAGSLDGEVTNNSAKLLVGADGYLPRADARGDAGSAPAMELMGRLGAAPSEAVIAGDVRANENIALTAVHTLFVREHNRIVDALPDHLSEQEKFEIARRVVGAEQQYITYREFLPTLGVQLAPYGGYDHEVDASLSNEFAVVGYRGHSMVHGLIEATFTEGRYTPLELEIFEDAGIAIEEDGDELRLEVPLNVAFGNPDLVPAIGLGPILAGLAAEAQYKNDEQIDNQLRSVLFQVPRPDVEDPAECLDGPGLPDCFNGVVDLGAIDIQRARDHGIPSYNHLRLAYGLPAKLTFKAITGEKTEQFPDDPTVDKTNPIDDPDILDFIRLFDADGNRIRPGSEEAEEGVVRGVRRTTLAARLKALYGRVGDLDAFVGMLAERHVRGTEFGQLQLAIWKHQFEALRDGDRFYYRADPVLERIERRFGITYKHTLAEIIMANTDATELQDNVFRAEEEDQAG